MLIGLIRTLHAWTGAVIAVVLVITGLTGALLAFKGDFIRLTVPQAREQVAATPQVLGSAADILEHVHHGELRYIIFAGPRLGVHQLEFTESREAYADKSGRILDEWTGPGRPETWVYTLHHFLLAGDPGMKVVGFAGLVAVFLALSGLIAWLPVWRMTSWRLWPKGVRRSDLLPAHRNIGLVFALPIILFCLTGAGMIFYKTTESLLVKALPGEAAEEFFPPVDPGDVDWVKALASAQAQFPKAQIRAAIWPQGSAFPAVVRLRQPGEWTPDGRTAVMIDPSTSQAIGAVDAMKLGRGYRLNNALYPIHVGAVGGPLYKALTALSGLALALLGLFGFVAFAIKPRRRRKRA